LTLTIIFLFASLLVILLGCELFTNGIEHFGKRLKITEGAIGSVFAAVGTALPESLVAVIAIIFGTENSGYEVGIGAILGAPFLLSTLAFFITGLAVLIFHRVNHRPLSILADHVVIGRDLRFFFMVYILVILAAFLTSHILKIFIAIFLLALYSVYIWKTFAHRGGSTEAELQPLHFHRHTDIPHLLLIILQNIIGLGLIIVGARFFIDHLQNLAAALGASALVLSAILTPFATELPEKLNSILWIRQRKDTLALGNISGAMVFQSSILPSIGLIFTSWNLTEHPEALVMAVIAISSAAVSWAEMTWLKRLSPYALLVGGAFYAAYLVYILK